MTRKDGIFPNYVRLSVNRDAPPEGWQDSALVCNGCGVKWPAFTYFKPTPCCVLEGVVFQGATPDLTWRDSVKYLLTSRFEALYDYWNDGATDLDLLWEEEHSKVEV
jgi:hypothetical protein